MAADTIIEDGVVMSADGARIAYRAWPKAGAQVTFAVVHGLGEHAGRYAGFAAAMARRGFGTYAMDLRGHGRSSGQRGHVDSWSQWTGDIAGFVKRVEELSGQEVVPLGHSFGGVAMLSTVLQGKLPTARRFIVSSPALRAKVVIPQWKVNLAHSASKFLPRLAMSNQVDAGTVSRIPEVVSAYRTDALVHAKISSRLFTEWRQASREVLLQAGQISIPFLIIAGTADNLIDSSGSEELHRVAKDKSELHLMPGGYHEPFNDADRELVFDLIADWLARR